MKKRALLLVGLFIVSLLLLFIGCETGSENQVLEGEYVFAAYGLDDSVPIASIHTMSFQATYDLLYDTIYSSQGDSDSGTISYTFTAEGTLYIDEWEGWVSSDRELIGLTDQKEGVDSYTAIGIGLRKGSDLDNSDVSGSYRYYQLSRDINNTEGIGSEIDLELNGDGTGSYTILSITGGGSGSGDLTYNLTADGSATVIIEPGTPGEMTFNGIVSSDGTKILIMDTDISDDEISIGLVIKKSTDMASEDIEGSDYYMFQYEDSDGDVDIDSGPITMEMSTFTYTLDQTGLMVVTEDSGDGIRGIVSPDGAIIVLMSVNTENGTIPVTDGEIDPGINICLGI